LIDCVYGPNPAVRYGLGFIALGVLGLSVIEQGDKETCVVSLWLDLRCDPPTPEGQTVQIRAQVRRIFQGLASVIKGRPKLLCRFAAAQPYAGFFKGLSDGCDCERLVGWVHAVGDSTGLGRVIRRVNSPARKHPSIRKEACSARALQH
jgi:hypothetical protein